MAKLLDGTRIYGTANVDSQLNIGSLGANNMNISNSTITIQGNATVNAVFTTSGILFSGAQLYTSNTYVYSSFDSLSTNQTITGVKTFAANLIFTTGQLIANNANGAAGQLLYSNGTGIYWANASGGFANGQSIQVTNIQVNNAIIANNSIGNLGQILYSNGVGAYWGNAVVIGQTGYQGSAGTPGGNTGYTGSAGVLTTQANTSYAYLNNSASTSGTGWQKVPIDTIQNDSAGWWDNTNKYFKPTIAGWYQIIGRARTNASNIIEALAIGKNGTQILALGPDVAGTGTYAVGGSGFVYLNGSTDYADLRVYADSSGSAYTTGGNFDTYIQISGPISGVGPTGYTGSSGTFSPLSYLTAYFTTNTSISGASANNKFVFNAVGQSNGNLISLNTSTGGFTLQGGYTYRLEGAFGGIGGSNVVYHAWTDINNNIIGNSSTGAGFSGTHSDAPNPIATAIFSPSVNTTVYMTTQSGGVGNLLAAAPGTGGFSSTWAVIQQIGGVLGYTGSAGINGYTGSIGYTGSSGTANTYIAGQVLTFTVNGSQNTFTYSSNIVSASDILVHQNGLSLIPTTDYTVSGNTVTLLVNPANNDIIEIRRFQGTAQGTTYGATGGGSDAVFQLNSTTVTSSYTIPTGKSAMSVGPISINNGVTITIPPGSKWVIL
jgi:hypothetical protein